MVDPKILCRNHLLGEHYECHKAMGCLNGSSTNWHIRLAEQGYLELHNLKSRHDELAEEMLARGYRHNSPMNNGVLPVLGKVNRAKSLQELLERCGQCRVRCERTQAEGA